MVNCRSYSNDYNHAWTRFFATHRADDENLDRFSTSLSDWLILNEERSVFFDIDHSTMSLLGADVRTAHTNALERKYAIAGSFTPPF
jgi:hypothetical protein